MAHLSQKQKPESAFSSMAIKANSNLPEADRIQSLKVCL